MKKREWLSLVMLACTVGPALLISYNKIFKTGVDGERLLQPETQGLLLEIAVLFGAAFAILFRVGDKRLRMGSLALETMIFTWMHQAFLPVAVSGLYLAVIVGVGIQSNGLAHHSFVVHFRNPIFGIYGNAPDIYIQ